MNLKGYNFESKCSLWEWSCGWGGEAVWAPRVSKWVRVRDHTSRPDGSWVTAEWGGPDIISSFPYVRKYIELLQNKIKRNWNNQQNTVHNCRCQTDLHPVISKYSNKISVTYHPAGIPKISNFHFEFFCIFWLKGINKKISSSEFSYRQQPLSIKV